MRVRPIVAEIEAGPLRPHEVVKLLDADRPRTYACAEAEALGVLCHGFEKANAEEWVRINAHICADSDIYQAACVPSGDADGYLEPLYPLRFQYVENMKDLTRRLVQRHQVGRKSSIVCH